MLTVINLQVIDNIFSESEVKLSSMAKMLYINILTHHFKDKKPTVVNAIAFDVFKNDIPNYSKYSMLFEELHKGGLINIGNDRISFFNSWGKHINRNLLDKVTPDVYVAGFQFQNPEQFKEDLKTNVGLHELCAMKNKISIKQVTDLIDLFIKEQVTFSKKYTDFSDCVRHFTFWLPNNISKTTNEHVKSNKKLLGE
jgi:regulator of RNase E activity RraB